MTQPIDLEKELACGGRGKPNSQLDEMFEPQPKKNYRGAPDTESRWSDTDPYGYPAFVPHWRLSAYTYRDFAPLPVQEIKVPMSIGDRLCSMFYGICGWIDLWVGGVY